MSDETSVRIVAEPRGSALANTPSASGEASPSNATADSSLTHQSPLLSPLLWAFVGSILLAVIYARSVLLHLGDGVIGGNGDGFENLWNNWWVKTSLLDLHQSPFF